MARKTKAEQEPVAMRYDYDGYGYKYIDSGSGSDWQTRIKDAEPLYATPPAAYPSRVMAALELATQNHNFELTVRNRMFVLVDRDRPRDTPFNMTMTHTPTSQWALEALERTLEELEMERAHALAQAAVRAAALAKLTKEERELLDL